MSYCLYPYVVGPRKHLLRIPSPPPRGWSAGYLILTRSWACRGTSPHVVNFLEVTPHSRLYHNILRTLALQLHRSVPLYCYSAASLAVAREMSDKDAQGWQVRAARKRSACERLIPQAWKLPSVLLQGLTHPLEASKNNLVALDIPRRSGILTEQELRITEAYDVRHLLQALASGELTSLEVTLAFCKRAAIAQQLARF